MKYGALMSRHFIIGEWLVAISAVHAEQGVQAAAFVCEAGRQNSVNAEWLEGGLVEVGFEELVVGVHRRHGHGLAEMLQDARQYRVEVPRVFQRVAESGREVNAVQRMEPQVFQRAGAPKRAVVGNPLAQRFQCLPPKLLRPNRGSRAIKGADPVIEFRRQRADVPVQDGARPL